MCEIGLVASQPRPWRPTTTVAGDAARTPDLLRRDFTAYEPGTKLVGDHLLHQDLAGLALLADRSGLLHEESRGLRHGRANAHLVVTDALAMATAN